MIGRIKVWGGQNIYQHSLIQNYDEMKMKKKLCEFITQEHKFKGDFVRKLIYNTYLKV